MLVNYQKSYFGSILSGQIANYNNDSSLSADFLTMHILLILKIKKFTTFLLCHSLLVVILKLPYLLLKNMKYNLENNQTILLFQTFLIFINEIKKITLKKALEHLNNSKSFLITDKMVPIARMAFTNLKQATTSLRKYEYKSEGLALSNIYFSPFGSYTILFYEKKSIPKNF